MCVKFIYQIGGRMYISIEYLIPKVTSIKCNYPKYSIISLDFSNICKVGHNLNIQ